MQNLGRGYSMSELNSDGGPLPSKAPQAAQKLLRTRTTPKLSTWHKVRVIMGCPLDESAVTQAPAPQVRGTANGLRQTQQLCADLLRNGHQLSDASVQCMLVYMQRLLALAAACNDAC